MTSGPQVIDLDREALKQGLADGSILVVDVREPHEFAAGHIPNSISHPLSAFDPERLRDDEARIVFSCAAGVRSVRALEFAQDSGLKIERHYRGGFKDWWMAGEPIG